MTFRKRAIRVEGDRYVRVSPSWADGCVAFVVVQHGPEYGDRFTPDHPINLTAAQAKKLAAALLEYAKRPPTQRR